MTLRHLSDSDSLAPAVMQPCSIAVESQGGMTESNLQQQVREIIHAKPSAPSALALLGLRVWCVSQRDDRDFQR